MNRILRRNVLNPAHIERSCARARKQVPKVRDKVQTAIAGILALWRANDYDAALLSAQQAEKENPKSGDISYFLGRSYLMVRPAQPNAADKAFIRAAKLGCSRPELLSTWIEARVITRNWVGIVEISSNVPPSQIRGVSALNFVDAMIHLARDTSANKDAKRAAAQMREAMVEADRIIEQQRAGDKLPDILARRKEAAEHYVQYAKALHVRAADKVDVFNATVDAFNCDVIESWILDVGIENLKSWAEEVIVREHDDPGALDILEKRTKVLASIYADLMTAGFSDKSVLRRINKAVEELAEYILQLKRKKSSQVGMRSR
jgi:hypothetical protein